MQKKVAFKDGQIVSFCASDRGFDEWWDLSDRSHGGNIPVEMKIPGDRLGRSAMMELNPETGESTPVGKKFSGNKKNGLYREWNGEDVLVLSAHYKGRKLDGLRETWFWNGQMCVRENWKNGSREGLREEWDREGQMVLRDNWKDGSCYGLREEWWSNGQLECRANFKDSMLDGLREYWNKTGQLQFRTNHKNNMFDGLYEEWYENGQLRKRINFKEDERNGLYEEWDESGRLLSRAYYKDGVPVAMPAELSDEVLYRDADTYDYERYPKGRVEPNLAQKEVEIVQAKSDHGFANYDEAKAWGKKNIARTYDDAESGGKGMVRISNGAIDKFLSQSAVDKSDSKDVHMSVLKVLPEVLKTSIEVETHPDFLKGADGKRKVENGVNKDVLVRRCYGAVNIDGKPYRVKITLKEDARDSKLPNNAFSYEATKIELLAGTLAKPEGDSPNTTNSIPAAKLLKDVEMSYNPGVKVLDASETANDAEGKISGRALSRKEMEAKAAYASRQWRRMKELSNEWTEKLHTADITEVYDSIDDVPGSADFSARRRRSKGWYDPKTGKIVIVMNNHNSPEDVLRTILHESVAHYGLRKLFGKHFDDFLDNVYDAAEEDVRAKIDAKMQALKGKAEGSKRTKEEWRRAATEEYLADLAEDSDFEAAERRPFVEHWFNKIKQFFLKMLNKLGLKGFGENVKNLLSDNELRYILWRSYQNMANPGRYRNIFQTAEDIAMQDRLGVGDYAKEEKRGGFAAEEREMQEVNERFNEELDDFKNGTLDGLLHLGKPSAILKACGVNVSEMTLSPSVLHTHLKKHNLTTDDLKGLALSMRTPIMVYVHGKNKPNIVVVTELDVNGGKLSATLKLDSNGEVVEIANISSVHSKDAEKELQRLYQMGEEDFSNSLKWVDKQKVLQWIAPRPSKSSDTQNNDAPFDVAKVINDFVNPSISEEKVSNGGTTISDMKQRVTELFEKAKTGEFVGQPASIGRLSAEGKAYLEKLSGLKFKEFVDFVLNPSDLNHIRSDHYGENEKDKGNNVPLTDEDIQNMVDVLNEPDGILYGVDKKDGRKLFFFLKDAGNGL